MFRQVVAYFLVVLLSVHAQAQSQPGKNNTVLWAVIGPRHDTSYIFGIFHQFGSSYFNRYPVIKEKINASECLVMETVADSLGRYVGADEPRHRDNTGHYVPANSWVNQLTADERNWLEKYFRKRGLSVRLDAFALYPPAVLMSTIRSIAYIDQCRIWTEDDFMPMEEWLANYSMIKNIKLIGLHSATQDMSVAQKLIADSVSNHDVDTIKDFVHDYRKYYNRITDCSAADNYLQLHVDYHFSQSSIEANANYPVALDRKNDEWLSVIEKILSQYNAFIAVKLEHLFYKDGLINKLSAAGYKVVPVAMKE